ncbi:hypothetical protein EC968_007207 [Mortierella alpina]|nr:hypothetical protein EC968_007207 [Mortierella alpina]
MSPMQPTSPFDIPEIASLIASYISNDADLARCARVSRPLHDICIPILWKSVHFIQLMDRADSEAEDSYRVRPYRYCKLYLIQELTIKSGVSDDEMELIAEHCTGLKVLNFDGAMVTVSSLAILIPSDRDRIHTEDTDPDNQSKKRKTRFPTHLESLKFRKCWGLAGGPCLETVSLLGPQLKRLYFDGFKDITDEDMINVVKRCPNLIDLRLNSTSITNEFLKNMAQEFLHESTSTHERHRRLFEVLNLNSNSRISSEGILPVVTACKSTLKTLSAQYVESVDDEVLFALVENPTDKDTVDILTPDLTTQGNAVKNASNKTPIIRYRFSPNTVLTEIHLSQHFGHSGFSLTDKGYQILFRFATELASITLASCFVEDGALMVLAETYRNRMKSLGLGVPAAWREYVLADERAKAMSRQKATAGGHRAIRTAAISTTDDSRVCSDNNLEVFTGRRVPGGLKRLDLRGCLYITNKGVRAILRSCVGLEVLDAGATFKLTLELFQGPWACTRLKYLNMSNMALETASQDAEDLDDEDLDDEELDDDRDGTQTELTALCPEEHAESLRFPLTMPAYSQEDDYDETGSYDHMAIPSEEYDGNAVRRNRPRHLAILRQFYSKLGELSQLQTLNMSCCAFRVRVKDGLELVLPALQQNLTTWYLRLGRENSLGNSELVFFGKHFGYGHNFADTKDGDQDRFGSKTRQAKLQHLYLAEKTLRHVHREVEDWAAHQGFHLKILKSSMSPTSPFDIPEIASLIASYISKDYDLAQCARVSHSLHDICIPILWKSINFTNLFYRRDPDFDKDGYRMDLIRFGTLSLIQELTYSSIIRDNDMEMIAEHCTGLKVLNFDGVKVTAESLAILIPCYRSQPGDVDPDDQRNTRKTRFPTNLESLMFRKCWGLAGPSCLAIISLLGSQLKRLHLEGFEDITDKDMIKIVRRCPNLVELRLNSTSITDEFLKNIAQDFLPSNSFSTPGLHRRPLEHLNLDWMKAVSGEGIIPVVMACRSTLKTVSFQEVRGINDKLLFALFKDLSSENMTEDLRIDPNPTAQANALKHTSDTTPIIHHRFSPNTVLTEISLQFSRITDEGYKVFFRFATELVSIKMDGCYVRDSALMVLAETYRDRMIALGLGVPAAWREHVLADERVHAVSRKGAAVEGHQTATTATIDAIEDRRTRDTSAKVFTGGHVPGGLKRLSLRGGGLFLTNRGIRAILRSCVGLEQLDIGNNLRLTLELFQGPWACSLLKDLDMSNLALESAPYDLESVGLEEFGVDFDVYLAECRASYEEELVESLRFPSTIAPYPRKDGFDEPGEHDYSSNNFTRTPRQCTILRQFYSKLGQLRKLRTLNMSEGNSELKFFGKNAGYGYDLTVATEDGQDQLECETRQANLEQLHLVESALRPDVRREVSERGKSIVGSRYNAKDKRKKVPKYSMPPTSPFDIPEIASLIASYISKDSDLARCARVSRSLHDICVPILWKSIRFSHLLDREHPDSAKRNYRVKPHRYGNLSLIEELTLTDVVRDDDMKMIAEHCTGLKTLHFIDAQVTAENLAVLIPSDHSQTEDIDPDNQPKRRDTPFPTNLESLRFKKCWGLDGPSCLKTVSLLGPQLKRLSLIRFKDIKSQDMIDVVSRCPNLVALQLKNTTIGDRFFMALALESPPFDCSPTVGRFVQHVQDLNLDQTKVSEQVILPVLMACRSTLKTLSMLSVQSVNDKLVFALLKAPDSEGPIECSTVAPDLTTQASALKLTDDKTPIMHHRFSPNTVLTEIRLSQSSGLTEAGFQALFRFATELVSIDLYMCDVGDSALMVLAETYRNRMKALGLGVPAAWREHVLADERVQAKSRQISAAGGQQVIHTAAISTAKDNRIHSDNDPKVFTGEHVPGGLKRLYLRGCKFTTNKGARAILRSCVGLEVLDIGECLRLTLDLFQGPWACLQLKDLNISGMGLELASRDLEAYEDEDPEDEPNFYWPEQPFFDEEYAEWARFPLATYPYPDKDDYDEAGNYDHITIRGDDYDDDGNAVRRNHPQLRATLREFYSKLGQLSQLQILNMSHCTFRVRVKDGLELILPGLQQNLTTWNLDLENDNILGNLELKFIGKHFGCGNDYAVSYDDGQNRLQGKTRRAQLQQLHLYERGLRDDSFMILDWVRRQGIDIHLKHRC